MWVITLGSLMWLNSAGLWARVHQFSTGPLSLAYSLDFSKARWLDSKMEHPQRTSLNMQVLSSFCFSHFLVAKAIHIAKPMVSEGTVQENEYREI